MDEQFDEIEKELKLKKEAFIEMYRKDPRNSLDEAVMNLQKKIQDFDPLNPSEIPELEAVGTTEEPEEDERLTINQEQRNVEDRSVIYYYEFSVGNYTVIVSDRGPQYDQVI